MSKCTVNDCQSTVGNGSQHVGSLGLPISVLFLTAEEVNQWEVEERQLESVIHQLFLSPRARQRLREDPDRFIARLKVKPRVKAILGLMKATLLTQQMVDPQFSWWWGAASLEEHQPFPGRVGGAREPETLIALG